VKARPALLALLSATILAMAAPTEEPSAPTPPPTVFAQPAGKFKLRLDGKAFLLPEELKPTVTRLMGEANYVKTRELYQALRRGLTEQALAETRIRQSEALALAAGERLEAVRRKHAALKEKLAAMLHDPESAPGADLNTYVQLETAIAAAAAQGEREEEIVAAAQAKAEAVRAKAGPTLEAARRQIADYAASLRAYERPLQELRALAAAKGTAL
jgi:molybdopterin converting factor small subunit